jgi:hypothetical protein
LGTPIERSFFAEHSTEQPGQRPFAIDAPAVTLVERGEGHTPDQHRRHDRPRVGRIVDEDAAPIRREFDQFVG